MPSAAGGIIDHSVGHSAFPKLPTIPQPTSADFVPQITFRISANYQHPSLSIYDFSVSEIWAVYNKAMWHQAINNLNAVALIAESADCCVYDADGLTVIIESAHCWFRFWFVLGLGLKFRFITWNYRLLSYIHRHQFRPIQQLVLPTWMRLACLL